MSKGLGKGLGALISIFEEDEVATAKSPPATAASLQGMAIQAIDVDLIDSNINQPRKTFETNQLQELADSIKSNGVLQPILVTQAGRRYMIIAGERRWRAARLAGLRTVPAIIKSYDARKISEIAIIENLQREDLNIIELAIGIKRLMDEFFLTQEKVAVALGKNRSSIANILRLLNLPAAVQQMIKAGDLSPGHAKALASITSPSKCTTLAKRCVDEGLSVRQLEDLLKHDEPIRSSYQSTKSQRGRDLGLQQLERDFTLSLGTKVTIQGDSERGKIIIEYFNKKDLSRISEHLS